MGVCSLWYECPDGACTSFPQTGAQLSRWRDSCPSPCPVMKTCLQQPTPRHAGAPFPDTGHQQREWLQGAQSGASVLGVPPGPADPFTESTSALGLCCLHMNRTSPSTLAGTAWLGPVCCKKQGDRLRGVMHLYPAGLVGDGGLRQRMLASFAGGLESLSPARPQLPGATLLS